MMIWKARGNSRTTARAQRVTRGPRARTLEAIAIAAAMLGAAPRSEAQQLPDMAGTAVPQAASSQAAEPTTGATGSAGFRTAIAIEVPAFLGIEPRIALDYHSSGGDAIAGVGWTLDAGSQIALAARGRGLPWLDGEHDDYELDGQVLHPCSGAASAIAPGCATPSGTGTGYYTDVDRGLRIESTAAGWTVWSQDGVQRIYSEIQSAPSGQPTAWLLSAVVSPLAPHTPVTYSYLGAPSDPVRYLSTIAYNGNLIELIYERRNDIREIATPGGGVAELALRLRAIDVLQENGDGLSRIRGYGLRYAYSGATGRSLLKAVEQLSRDARITVAGGIVEITSGSDSLPPEQFTYQSEAVHGTLDDASYGSGARPLPPVTTALGNALGGYAAAAVPGDTDWTDVALALPPDAISPTVRGDPSDGGVVVGDFDGNGASDWAWVVSPAVNPVTQVPGTAVMFALGDGRGGWRTSAHWIYSHAAPAADTDLKTQVLVGDRNGDGRPDLTILRPTEQAGDRHWYVFAATFEPSLAEMTAWDTGQTIDSALTSPVWTPCNGDPACVPRQLPAPVFALADVSGDGIADIVDTGVASVDGDSQITMAVEWHLAMAGGYGGHGMLALPPLAGLAVVPGDVNGDGRVDLVVSGFTSAPSTGIAWQVCPFVSAAPAAAGITFEAMPCRTVATGLDPFTVAYGAPTVLLADVNGDGRRDAVLWYQPYGGDTIPDGPGQFLIALARGQGLLDPAIAVADPRAAASASSASVFQVIDLDGDGADDLISPSGDALLARAMPDASGAFYWRLRSHVRPRTAFGRYVVGDFDGDGVLDAAVLSRASATTPLIVSRVSLPTTGAAPDEWLRGDVDGDGLDDAIHVVTPARDLASGVVRVTTALRRVDRATGATRWLALAPQAIAVAPGSHLTAARVADLDGNGRAGLLLIDGDAGAAAIRFTALRFQPAADPVGGSWAAVAWPIAMPWPSAVAEDPLRWFIGDVTGDGLPDAIELLAGDTSIGYVVFDLAARTMTAGSQPLPAPDATGSLYLAGVSAAHRIWQPIDVNGDGALDLVSVRDEWLPGAPPVLVRAAITLISDRRGGFAVRLWQGAPAEPVAGSAWRVADPDGDGVPDLVAVTSALNPTRGAIWQGNPAGVAPGGALIVRALSGTGDGGFQPRDLRAPAWYSLGNQLAWTPWQCKFADADGDGMTDLMIIASADPHTAPGATGSVVYVYQARTTAAGTWLWADHPAVALQPQGIAPGVDHAALRWTAVDDDHDGRAELEYALVDHAGDVGGADRLAIYGVRGDPGHDALVSLVDVRGAETRVAYDTAIAPSGVPASADTPTVTLSGGWPGIGGLVARTITRDAHTVSGTGRGRVVERRFDHPVWQASRRRLHGFAEVTMRDAALGDDGAAVEFANRPARVTTTQFALADDRVPADDTSFACGLRPSSVSSRAADASGVATATTTEYVPPGDGPAAGAPYLCRTAQTTTAIAGASGTQTSVTRVTYDRFGLPAQTEQLADDEAVTSSVDRAIAPASYVVAATHLMTWQGSAAAPGPVLREIRMCYDAAVTVAPSDPATAIASCAPPRDAGRVTGVLQSCPEPSCAAPLAISTTHYDDGAALPSSLRDAIGTITTLRYADVPGVPVALHVVESTQATGTPAERTTSYAWDHLLGVVTAVTEPGNRVRRRTEHDGFGRPVQRWTEILDASGGVIKTVQQHTTQYVDHYDVDGYLGVFDSVIQPGGFVAETDTVLDAFGRAIYSERAAVDAGEHDTFVATRMVYGDDSARPYLQSLPAFAAQLPDGVATTTYDHTGREVARTQADGATTTSSVDVVRDGARSYLVSVRRDPSGHARCTAVDGFGRLARSGDTADCMSAGATVTRFEHDAAGQLTRVIDPLGNTTASATWDSLGRPRSETDPDGGTRRYTRNAAGNVTQAVHSRVATDGSETVIDVADMTYDALGRRVLVVVRVPGPDGALLLERAMFFIYDETDDVGPTGVFGAGLGRLTSIYDTAFPGGCDDPAPHHDFPRAARFKYDELGNLLARWRCVDTDRAYEIRHTYDDAQRLATTRWDDGETVTYGYDHASHPVSAAITWTGAGQAFVPLVVAAHYGAADQPTDLALGNGVVTSYHYESKTLRLATVEVDGWIAGSAGSAPGVIYRAGYGYHADGQVRSLTVGGAVGASDLGFTYDDRHRLTEISGSRPENFGYDDLGRLRTRTGADGASSFDYPIGSTPDYLHATTSGTTGTGSYLAHYDLAGQLREIHDNDGSRSYGWDGLGQLRSVTTGDTWVTFDYAADGARVRRSENGAVTYEPFPELEIDPDGHRIKHYGFAGQAIAHRDASGAIVYHHADHLGSTVAITRTDGTYDPDSGFHYTAFGATDTTHGALAADRLFTGAPQRATTGPGGGLVYLAARYYDPALQQFLSPDTIATGTTAIGFHRYAYADQDPINLRDPSGHLPIPSWLTSHDPNFDTCPASVCSAAGASPTTSTTPSGATVGSSGLLLYPTDADGPEPLPSNVVKVATLANHNEVYYSRGMGIVDIFTRHGLLVEEAEPFAGYAERSNGMVDSFDLTWLAEAAAARIAAGHPPTVLQATGGGGNYVLGNVKENRGDLGLLLELINPVGEDELGLSSHASTIVVGHSTIAGAGVDQYLRRQGNFDGDVFLIMCNSCQPGRAPELAAARGSGVYSEDTYVTAPEAAAQYILLQWFGVPARAIPHLVYTPAPR